MEDTMTGRKSWRMIAAAAGLILIIGAAGLHAQQKTETEAVLAASHEFDKALSTRDIGAMGKAWAHEPYVIVIHPVSNAPLVGWEAVRKSWEQIFDRWAEISVSMKDPQVRVSQNIAWIFGVEIVQGKLKSGKAVSSTAFATNIFEKRDGRWSMVLHTASRVPSAQGF
jgi:ketosteroid isomerase-like protein